MCRSVAGAADYPQRSGLRASGRRLVALWCLNLCDAYGMAAANWRSTKERLPLLDRNRLQHFPLARSNRRQRARIRTLAQSVLDARGEFPNSTLADLYDVDVMPHQLRKAHQELDKAVDKLYLLTRRASSISRASSTSSERVEVSPATATASNTSSASTNASSRHWRQRLPGRNVDD